MVASTAKRKACEEITAKVFASADLGQINWTSGGECRPWLFDSTVHGKAVAACAQMEAYEHDAFVDCRPQTDAFHRTLRGLYERYSSSDYAVATLVVFLYQYMETISLEDVREPDCVG